MRLTHWMALIGLVVGLGCLQVTQRNALVFKGYAVGERMGRVHRQEADVSWLNMRVVGLTSPTHLSQVAKERRLNLVARMTLPPAGEHGQPRATPSRPLVHLAAITPEQPSLPDDTSD